MKSRYTIALAGNPNAGKTTVFNAITGSRQHVGNYPGVTVEKKEGFARHNDVELNIVDLPGTYSLTAYSVEEVVARNVLLEDKPDVVVDIVDSSNLERNLYLATQLAELSVPLVLAFNMSDVAENRGCNIDEQALAELLGVPIVKTVGHKNRGISALLDAVVAIAQDPAAAIAKQRRPNYGPEIEPHVKQLTDLIRQRCRLDHHDRWFAVKLLEGDEETARRINRLCPAHTEELLAEADRIKHHVEGICGDPAEIILADRRYGYISGACTESVTQTVEARHASSDKIDAVLTNRWLGLPIFALLMYMVFQFTFAFGNPAVDFLDGRLGELRSWVIEAWPGQGVLESLVVDGIIGGVGQVVVFVPLIMLLFMAISILEDTGYMARAAFVIDRLMHKIGLHGKSFIPMLIGFGCTVPGIMATRTLEARRDRLTTILVLPLMSCAARMPIYLLILGAFFPPRTVFKALGIFNVTNQAMLLFAIYLIGIILAIVCAKLLRKTLLRGEAMPFVMELPPYRMPTVKGLAIHMWERTWLYLRKAGTIILMIVVILWAMATWPALSETQVQTFEQQRTTIAARADLGKEQIRDRLSEIDNAELEAGLEHSAIGRIGRAVAPVLRPCGFDWKISTAMLGAFAAKEVFVGQMGLIYSVGADADEQSHLLRDRLAAEYSPLQGFCIMLFCLISMPCMVTVVVTARESGSLKWALLQVSYLTVLAWVITTAVYQAGSALGM
ncbi:MAG: ferrous iron transport protein B [Planctomycetota bacterium]|nr:ferrous iron transport protein B [Planctomycetota bacterium]